ncbi:MAG TPA: hypothetical protein VGJ26_03375 [Pirellulales bacterium]
MLVKSTESTPGPDTEDVDAANPADVEERFCEWCCRYRPIEEFRRYRKDSEQRHSECNECRNRLTKERKEAKLRGDWKKHVQQLDRARSANERQAVLDLMLEAFGGPVGVAALWHSYIKKAADEGHSVAVVKALTQFVKVKMKCDADRKPVDVSGLTDADLERQFQELARSAGGDKAVLD